MDVRMSCSYCPCGLEPRPTLRVFKYIPVITEPMTNINGNEYASAVLLAQRSLPWSYVTTVFYEVVFLFVENGNFLLVTELRFSNTFVIFCSHAYLLNRTIKRIIAQKITNASATVPEGGRECLYVFFTWRLLSCHTWPDGCTLACHTCPDGCTEYSSMPHSTHGLTHVL